MRITFVPAYAFLLAAALLLTSCAEPLVPRQQVFHESDFRGYGGTGSGSVVGRAFVVMRDHSERTAANEIVQLTPVNPYSTECVTVVFAQNRELTPSDPRFDKYIHSTRTDADGNFAFHNLPSGEYYVTSAANFTHWFWNMDNTEKVVDHDCVPVYARVAVKSGQTTRVTDWNYGRQTSR